LLSIHSALSGKKVSEIENDFAGKGYGDFKAEVAEVVVDHLRPIRDRALELLQDEAHLVQILHVGADKARAVASATVAQSYKNLGLVL
jgi:tryptophanyl-tRNA synthetase